MASITNKKLLSKRKVSHQTNLQGSLQEERHAGLQNRTPVSDVNFLHRKKPSGGKGYQTERVRTKSFGRERQEQPEPTFARSQFKELISKMYDEDSGTFMEAKNKFLAQNQSRNLAGNQTELAEPK